MVKNPKEEKTKKGSASVKTTVRTVTSDDEAPVKKGKPAKTAKTAKPAANKEVAETAKLSRKERRAQKKANDPVHDGRGYFKGAWYELRQVRWPDRKTTWSMTFAVILFTAFIAAFVLLLDALFKWLFNILIG